MLHSFFVVNRCNNTATEVEPESTGVITDIITFFTV
jgi:hypothetical protein